MIELLSRLFIKDRENIQNPAVRAAYGTLCSVTGIVLNLLLFAGKYLAGVLTGSIAITADAFNNLSDAGSSIITLLGFKIATKEPDPQHPYGHGRFEYISGFVIALIILLLGFELAKSAFDKILNPAASEWSLVSVIILGVSILVKGYMALYNTHIGNKISSPAMKAVAADSLSDMAATAVVLVCSLLERFFGIQIDGWAGLAVSLFIFYNGIKAAKETIAPLLGTPADKETVSEISRIVLETPCVSGLHDLLVHDYGPGRKFISLHAEVPAGADILEIHDHIDNLEKVLYEQLGYQAVVHMDPIALDDEETQQLTETVRSFAKSLSDEVNIHDFRMVRGETHTNLIFDIVVPFKFCMTDDEVRAAITAKIKAELGEQYNTVIQVDKSFIE